MSRLTFSTFLLALYFSAPVNAEGSGCLEVNTTIPDFCIGISQQIFEFYHLFKNTRFDSPEIATLDTESMKRNCDRYRGCPTTNHVNCWLPRLPVEQPYVCNRVYALQSSYGRCMRKYLVRSPFSANLRVLFNDRTPEGQLKKCELLRWDRDYLEYAIKVECGKDPEWSFNAMRNEIHGFYDCDKYRL